MHLRRWGLALLAVTGLTGCIRVTADAHSEADVSITGPGTGNPGQGADTVGVTLEVVPSYESRNLGSTGQVTGICRTSSGREVPCGTVAWSQKGPYVTVNQSGVTVYAQVGENDVCGHSQRWNIDGCGHFRTLSTGQTLEACRDTKDNDGDGLIDANDPGCHSDGNANNPSSYVPTDNDETNGGTTGFSVTPTQGTFRIGLGCTTQPITFSVTQGTIASATSSDGRVILVVNPGAGTIVATWNNPTNAQAPAWVVVTFTSTTGQTQQSTIYFDSSPCQTQPGAPDFNFVPNPTNITVGQSSVLSWSPIQNVASCPSSSFGGAQPITGTYTVSPTTTTTYTLTCANAAGVQVTKSATVTVTQVASCGSNTIQFSPNPISVRVGQTVRVNVMNWQLSFNSDCIPWGYIGGPPGSAANGDGFRIATMTNSEILYTPSSPAGSPSYKAGRWIEITGRATGTTTFCYQAGISNTLPASCGTLTVTP